nr:HD domain-containing protein [Clostridiales bacterium]
MPYYEHLSHELTERIEYEKKTGTFTDFSFKDEDAIRRNPDHDTPTVIRPAFIRDADKILHCPQYNRYADKTQVFSLYKNDDISRRSLHVQLVSRIARTIGQALNLNLNLIEAIALGHDIGHTPFGHEGERILDALLQEHTGRRFAHNIQSVRVLDDIYPYNITLQTLNGIAAHNGEIELAKYRPKELTSFDEFDSQIEGCFTDIENNKRLVPCTLEGCVMRISDIIAYLGKDRQDAQRAHIISEEDFEPTEIGSINAEIINNLITNIVENSYGMPYIKMDEVHFKALQKLKSDNYLLIYKNDKVQAEINKTVKPMMTQLYEKLLSDLKEGRRDSPIYKSHIEYVSRAHYERKIPYADNDPDTIVCDFIASM